MKQPLLKYTTVVTEPDNALYSALHELPCIVQVTIGLYHVFGKMLRREQFLNVTTVGYSAVIFGCALLVLCSYLFAPNKAPTCHFHNTTHSHLHCLMATQICLLSAAA